MAEKNKKRRLKGLRRPTENEIRKMFEDELVEEHGADYLKKNKGLLDAQWEYIVDLGLPDFIVTPDGKIVTEQEWLVGDD